MNTHDDPETLAPPTDVPAPAGAAAAAGSALAATLALAACGGGSEEGDAARPAAAAAGRIHAQATEEEKDAFRLLTQATFGPTLAGMQDVATAGGRDQWIDAQLGMPPHPSVSYPPTLETPGLHLARFNQAYAPLLPPAGPGGHPDYAPLTSSFYELAVQAEDQLRHRVAFALSQIFVVSTVDLTGHMAQAAASYLDMLYLNAFGSYRTLLEDVTKHPAMGIYLSTLDNKREDPSKGRIPDQNYAREVMQLFSIGLVHLKMTGEQKEPVTATYGPDDIVAMSRIFTGLVYSSEDLQVRRTIPMVFREVDHSRLEKVALYRFNDPDHLDPLVTIGATADGQLTNPEADLAEALNKLATHANTAPFISRQLIQRLVTSHPTKAYVQAVAEEFVATSGNLGAVVRKILTHTEARTASEARDYGKPREPVLRLTALLRAYGATSQSGLFKTSTNHDPATGIAQAPMHSPNVFNFFRPGFVPLVGKAKERGLTVPEFQIATEVSVAGYVNSMIGVLQSGFGRPVGNSRDVTLNLSALTVSTFDSNAAGLAAKAINSMIGPDASLLSKNAFLLARVIAAIETVPVGATGKAAARLRRARIALTLVLASPEFIVQR